MRKYREHYLKIRKLFFPLHVTQWVFGIGIIEYPNEVSRPLLSFFIICCYVVCFMTATIWVKLYGKDYAAVNLFSMIWVPYTNFPSVLLTFFMAWHANNVSKHLQIESIDDFAGILISFQGKEKMLHSLFEDQ